MDDIRDSFSRFKKGIKHRLTGRKRKGDQPGTGENETSGSVARPGVGATADEDGSDWKATASASTKLLRGVRDSADALGPLKSVAGGLCFILENYEVSFPYDVYLQCSQALRRTKANEQTIESLTPRVKSLAESLCKRVSKGDAREQERRQKLEQ